MDDIEIATFLHVHATEGLCTAYRFMTSMILWYSSVADLKLRRLDGRL
jgi:hypothetical protein